MYNIIVSNRERNLKKTTFSGIVGISTIIRPADEVFSIASLGVLLWLAGSLLLLAFCHIIYLYLPEPHSAVCALMMMMLIEEDDERSVGRRRQAKYKLRSV